ncbi:MAG: 2-isopropylmalate synthase [Brevinematales bacterium]
MKDKKIIIFDTTLRDGEQSPGASMAPQDKVRFAKQLEKLGVDVIEAGFAVSSPVQAEGIRMISGEVSIPVIASLARAVEKDIEAAASALEHAVKKRIHIVLATSPVHRKYKLNKSPGEILKMAVNAVCFARRFADDVEFSAEDASRTEPDFLLEVLCAAAQAGASTVNIPDSVGYSVPGEFMKLIRAAAAKSGIGNRAVISAHCHNDLGLAAANSMAAVEAGAAQIEVSVNGIGERAGNAALEEVVMALHVRKDWFHALTGIHIEEIYETSRLLTEITGIQVQPNKAVVGKNAFSHESGIHQDGFLKERSTYEIIRPESIGRPPSEIILGRHSGRHGVRARLKALGIEPDDEQMDKIFEKFTLIADRKKAVTDEELAAISLL